MSRATVLVVVIVVLALSGGTAWYMFGPDAAHGEFVRAADSVCRDFEKKVQTAELGVAWVTPAKRPAALRQLAGVYEKERLALLDLEAPDGDKAAFGAFSEALKKHATALKEVAAATALAEEERGSAVELYDASLKQERRAAEALGFKVCGTPRV